MPLLGRGDLRFPLQTVMIYICKGIGAVCSAPCKICDACCKGLSQACDGCSKGCADCIGPITQAPLATYVLVTFSFMAAVVIAAGHSLTTVECKGPKSVCLIMCALGLIHASFAFYIQRRLVCAIGKVDAKSMTYKEIASKTSEIMLYDFGFCLYIPVFIGSMCYPLVGASALTDCAGTGAAWVAAVLLVLYGLIVGSYFVCWACYNHCCSAAQEIKGGVRTRGLQSSEEPDVEADEEEQDEGNEPSLFERLMPCAARGDEEEEAEETA